MGLHTARSLEHAVRTVAVMDVTPKPRTAERSMRCANYLAQVGHKRSKLSQASA